MLRRCTPGHASNAVKIPIHRAALKTLIKLCQRATEIPLRAVLETPTTSSLADRGRSYPGSRAFYLGQTSFFRRVTTMAPPPSSEKQPSPPPELRIYNTMSKQKELFKSWEPGKVGMYVCGVTPYDYSHIGHARAYVTFDVLHRYLKHLGYEVRYVRNFTDIDDKIIKRANEVGQNPLELSDGFCQEFTKDMEVLQCLPPTDEPRVSTHIESILTLIDKIMENGCAYTIDGDVYFSVDQFPKYGCLSGRKLDDNRAGGGGRVVVDTRKKNPADFALWKAAKPGEPSWESKWGPGRPGWHIECSAMSREYLSDCFDIHGGGKDLVFPHHENEVAQSCAAHPESNVSYWMHNGFVNRDNEKMSKSEKNFFTIRDIVAKYHPLALRFFLIRTHYRSDVNFSDRALENASDRLFYIYQTLFDCEEALQPFQGKISSKRVPSEFQELINTFHNDFLASMSDDLHTTPVLDDLVEPLKTINNNLKKVKGKKQLSPFVHALAALEKEVKDVLGILGLLCSSSSEVLQQLKEKALLRAGLTEEQVFEFMNERALARKNKEYERSDQIRKDLEQKGIFLMDEPKGTIWRPRERPEDDQPEVGNQVEQKLGNQVEQKLGNQVEQKLSIQEDQKLGNQDGQKTDKQDVQKQ